MLWLENEWFYKINYATFSWPLMLIYLPKFIGDFEYILILSSSLSLSFSLFVEKYRENNNKDLKDIHLIYSIIYNISNFYYMFCLCSCTSFDTSNNACCLCCWISLDSSNIVDKSWSSRLDFFFFLTEYNPKIIKNLTKRMRIINTKIFRIYSPKKVWICRH